MSERTPEEWLHALWEHARQAPELADLVALVPTDRRLGLVDAFALAPVVMARLVDPADTLRALDALARVHAEVRGYPQPTNR